MEQQPVRHNFNGFPGAPLAALIAAAVLLASCASVPPSRTEAGVARILELVEIGNEQALASLSSAPFLLDRELLMTEADILSFWTAIPAMPMRFEFDAIQEIVELNDAGIARFAGSWEEEVYLRTYLPDDAAAAVIRDGERELVLFLGGNRGGYPFIHGYRGGQ
jgi:hypothetical protein